MKQKEFTEVKPFLKWAGGKRWLVSKNSALFPKSYNTYIEPFVGSGAVFFYHNPSHAILSDKNEELIETYQSIKTDWKAVWEKLKYHHRKHSYDHYYTVRSSKPRSLNGRTARFIYLNRTCFNGLYRVNLKGEFNVPKGTKNDVTYSDDNFEEISRILNKCELYSYDFELTISRAQKGDFIYVDPPYTVKHNNNNFIKYNETIFSWEDQLRLADALYSAKSRGAIVLLSNADNKYIHELYKGFGNIVQLQRQSVLAGKPDKRQLTTELLISTIKN